MTTVLRADHEVALSYRRSVGGATALFLAGLARAEIWGSRDGHGRVTVPPVDWDPFTGVPTADFVPVGQVGVVRSWTWGTDPLPEHPLDRPFGLALIQLQGSDSALLHVVDVAGEDQMWTGMTVHADWRPERTGSIRDIRAFCPGPAGEPDQPDEPDRAAGDAAPAGADLEVVSDVRTRYTFAPGWVLSAFLGGLAERRIEGGRCPSCSGVYVPPHATCPACQVGPMVPVEMPHRGTVTSYTVVHIPFHGMTIDLPFICAWIRLDGAAVPFAHLLGEVAPDEVAVGDRVEAVWVGEDELAPTWESIRYFRPLASDETCAG